MFASPESLHKSVFSFKLRGLRLLPLKLFGDSQENVLDMYGDSRENVFENLAVVIILSPISSVRGYGEGSVSRIDRMIGLFCKRAL